jgi:hypothetical protein
MADITGKIEKPGKLHFLELPVNGENWRWNFKKRL